MGAKNGFNFNTWVPFLIRNELNVLNVLNILNVLNLLILPISKIEN